MLRVGIKKLRAYGDFTRIRKVFRRRRSYACGMCRTEYKYHAEAQGCLNECILEMLREYPVIQKSLGGNHGYYMCKLCARRYSTRKQAEICGEDCKARIFNIANQYAEVSPAETPTNRPQRRKKVMLVSQSVRKIKKGIKEKEDPVIEPIESNEEAETIESDLIDSPTSDQADGATQSEADVKAEETEQVDGDTQAEGSNQEDDSTSEADGPKPKRDQKKKWHRADAKYVCETCAEEYFTRIEAEQCWQAHSPDFDE